MGKPKDKHGLSRSPEYRIWVGIHQRCGNPTNNHFAEYGARGISVCESWSSFRAFYADMGPRPSPLHSIERKRNDLGYSPRNCAWALRVDQQNNRRGNRIIRFRGRAQTLAQWAAETGLSRHTIQKRLNAGWTPRDALTKPRDQHRRLSK